MADWLVIMKADRKGSDLVEKLDFHSVAMRAETMVD